MRMVKICENSENEYEPFDLNERLRLKQIFM
jgi:hypothetical protein